MIPFRVRFQLTCFAALVVGVLLAFVVGAGAGVAGILVVVGCFAIAEILP